MHVEGKTRPTGVHCKIDLSGSSPSTDTTIRTLNDIAQEINETKCTKPDVYTRIQRRTHRSKRHDCCEEQSSLFKIFKVVQVTFLNG